jgi:calcineurin-like phosphoesterase family protein
MSFTQKFYTADHHFGHQLMLSSTACARPFSSVREMDEFLIDAWNSVVRPADLVFHLGDFAFGLGDAARVASIFRRLNGRKRLVLGNHDFSKPNVIHPSLLKLEWDAPPTAALETTDEGQRVYLSHYAARTWPGQHRGAFHFYGHSHGRLPPFGRSRDVGVDCPDVGYAPRTFKQLVAEMDLEPVVAEELEGFAP